MRFICRKLLLRVRRVTCLRGIEANVVCRIIKAIFSTLLKLQKVCLCRSGNGMENIFCSYNEVKLHPNPNRTILNHNLYFFILNRPFQILEDTTFLRKQLLTLDFSKKKKNPLQILQY